MESNRRSFLAALAATSPALAKACSDLPEPERIETVAATSGHQIFVLSLPYVDAQIADNIQEAWRKACERAGVPAPPLLVLDGGAILKVFEVPR